MPIVDSAIEGYNGSILAYGQTGTGKTYTMIGNQDGILPLTVSYILSCNKDQSLSLAISALQIYNEQVALLFNRSQIFWLKMYKTAKLSPKT
jgi:hypothetical protein